MGRLDDKVMVITGAGSGIGAATARLAAREGAKVVIGDINESAAASVAAELVASGAQAIAVAVDVGDESQVQGLIDAAVGEFGGIDVMHNNAALTSPQHLALDHPVADLDADVWDRTLDVNLRGVMLGCKHAIPVLLGRGGGAIVNTSSLASMAGDLRNSAYGVSKAGVNMLTLYVATQYGKRGIRCNAVMPAGIASETLLESTTVEWRDMMRRQFLLSDFGSAEDVASAVLFLASDESRFVTGQVLAVDGGYGSHTPRFAQMLDAQLAPAG